MPTQCILERPAASAQVSYGSVVGNINDSTGTGFSRQTSINPTINGMWELPFRKSRRWKNRGGPVSWLDSGWQINGIMSAVAGSLISIRLRTAL